MARPLSNDLRERMVRAVEAGASRHATARRFEVSVSCVIKLVQRWRRTGSVAPGQMGGQREHALAEHEARVRALVAASPDMILDELRESLEQQGVRVGRTSVWRFLKARGLTLKKRPSTRRSSSDRMSRRPARRGARDSRR